MDIKSRLIFLDVDGVLNSARTMHAKPMRDSYLERNWGNLDPVAVTLVARICRELDVKVVISSTWRKLYTTEEFKSNFKDHYGWDIPIVGMTGNGPGGFRGDQIAQWLEDNPQYGVGPRDYNSYCIIDDDGDMHSWQPFVNINGMHGFSIYDYYRVISILDPNNDRAFNFLETQKDWECKKCGGYTND